MNSFTIYKEYFELITLLSEKEQQELLYKITKYMLYDEEPELNDRQIKIFNNLKRPLNKSKEQSKRRTNQKPNENQIETNQKPKGYPKENTSNDVNVNVKGNVNVNNNNLSVYEYIEQNFGRLLSPIEIEKIEKCLEMYPPDIIKYAVSIATLNNKKTFNYVNGIINNWRSSGYETLEDIKKNEEIKIPKSNITEEQQQMLDELEGFNWIEDGVEND